MVVVHMARRTGALLALLGSAVLAGAVGCGKEAPPQMPAPEVLVAPVTTRDVPVWGEWVGTIAGLVTAEIRAKVQGYLLTQNYKDGGLVQEGAVLFQLDPRQYKAALDQANADLAQAKAMYVRAQQNVSRYRPLVEKGAVSRKELDDAIQTMLANEAQMQAAQAAIENAKLNLDWTTIRAPITGIAGIAQAQIGDLIAPSTVMTTMSTLDEVKVYFPISEPEYLRFTAAHPDAVQNIDTGHKERPLTLILADGSTYPHAGEVAAVGREVQVSTGALQLQAKFPNPGNVLRPGGYAKVRAVTELRKGALLVPQRAVMEVQGNHQVAVLGKDDTVEIRPVTVGPKTESEWVIEKGLQPGDRVVAEGVQKLRPGMKVVAKPYAAPGSAPAGAAAAS